MKNETPTRRIVPAMQASTPATNAPSSVFAAGQAAKPKRPHPAPPDPAKVTIRKGVPLPAVATGPNAIGAYKEILDGMKKGDSVVLTLRQAKSMVSSAKKAGIKVAMRRTGDDEAGVWRQS